ncbi:DUF4079 domain-containing protein [Synechococcus sp. PCC 7336]|uniref:DUF4079 domain-containing protein n=1 Tax=Synechococcus sp. PCC 7336 TaxID=195250 RepID=UPI00034CAA34|nr:DUF4079 domain-containing protein [Synechococcus sp. PCC 7336]
MLPLFDASRILHPILAIVFVFPVIGIATFYAWQTRQRRLATAKQEKSKIPPVVGGEHVKIGRWLAASVVGVALVGLLHPTVKYIVRNNRASEAPAEVAIVALLFAATIVSCVLLYRAKPPLWRGVFATLSGLGIVLIGWQDKVLGREGFGAIFRRDDQWYLSHFYYGMAVVLLMVFAVAIQPDIYKDRSNTWRRVHIALNCIALLLFISQGVTGARDLLEIPLGWQESTVFGCDFANRICP